MAGPEGRSPHNGPGRVADKPPVPLAIVLRATDKRLHSCPRVSRPAVRCVALLVSCPAFGIHEYSSHEGERTVQWIGNCLQPDASNSSPTASTSTSTQRPHGPREPLQRRGNGAPDQVFVSPGAAKKRQGKKRHKKSGRGKNRQEYSRKELERETKQDQSREKVEER
ncbi:hypothetical protein E2C01_031909 [Portunus trituberculatus]|uniref:Uncharacterized protein n=1 Tax=Portunus trituberculatus TaxID=210409 RepID=A0A5B7F1C5_PORTR|nr:hypothetical protein [Portunus trituberculatus]